MTLVYHHVDVFSSSPFSGNSLSVFCGARGLNASQMLRITKEFRHFESIFLMRGKVSSRIRARIFDLLGELPFAGHPLIGAAAVLHHIRGHAMEQHWEIALPTRIAVVSTERTRNGFLGWLEQGAATVLREVSARQRVADAFSLTESDLCAKLPLEVITTGLCYLIVPVKTEAMGRARIVNDITSLLYEFGAQFAVLFDEETLEIRHWNNDGLIEDIATGSAAGTIGGYRLRHNLIRSGDSFDLQQGRFTGRSSTLQVQVDGRPDFVRNVRVGGYVALVGHGILDVMP